MALRNPEPTRRRILAAAESLFARHGFAAVSLRQITAAARVNVAAVNYHFHDREQLYLDLVRQRLRTVNRERLELLGDAEAHAPGDPAPLSEVFSAMARPLFLPSAALGPHGPRLIGRLLTEHQAFADEVLRAEFDPTMNRFGQALRRHHPAMAPADFVWRINFVTGALHHAVVTLPDIGLHTRGFCSPADCAGALRNFVAWASNAFRV